MGDILNNLKRNELRIGNYINRNKYTEHITVIGVLHQEVKTDKGTLPYRIVEPIKLTEEWIVKLGFIFMGGDNPKHSNFYVKHWGKNGSSILRYHPYYDKFVFELGSHSFKPIAYVHQLQNIYFSITEHELTIQINSNED